MKHRYLMSVAAAALIAGGGLAHAQGTGSGGSMSGGGAAQGAGPATERGGSSVVPMNRNEPSGMKGSESAPGPNGMKSTQSDQKAGDRNQRAQDAPSGAKSDGKSERSSDSRDGSRDGSKAAKDMKAEDRNNARDSNRDAAEQGRDSKSTTTGQAGAGGKMSSEQRSKITTVIKQQRVEPATNVNFSISIGTRVPREVRFHPLPAEIITVYPDWRGYEFFLVRGEIIVVNPRTMEIVAVLDA